MSNVLTKIVDTKAAHIAALKQRFPEDTLSPQLSNRSLYQALKVPNAGFILECKKASPSKGLIRDDFNLEAISDVYTRYAAGISVLTDEQFFQGNMDFIPIVRARVTQPVLCKDFFVDPYQIKLAAHQGADAILLMLSVLDDMQYARLATEAARYQLDVLTEVSNEAELERAIKLNAPIIGINNRNLRDLSTDLAVTEALAPLIPDDRVVISESGIYTHAQVKRLSPLVNGFLVGSSVMSQDDIDLACRMLTLGHNKVCGLTRIEDIRSVTKAGAVYGGLIFAKKSPRALTLEQATRLMQQLTPSDPKLQFVGVFVNEAAQTIATIAAQLHLFAVQLHGNETEDNITQVKAALASLKLDTQVWKAVPVSATSATETLNIPENADRILFDSQAQGQFGATGQTFDWQQAHRHKEEAMLAGGLTPDNAQKAATQGFYGLDFNSGVEQAPGIKDYEKVTKAFNTLRQY
ncbi:bifunctional indole-3-glycerol-phosphate synthase TrpC/phosphoribosylanthranilate isomerase TrpF [Shewanella surugensis]|uniref:Multifunctional fusion protein n=1 Tax=Shewanella surugensis TaxID=212020 RepID=A0ABT0LHH3_9GAMM|nr:bifunctional indole-3-glycerol-phosphate synthase TrpC/phosphoribosylanthranilate isomerase TrpF [Shewanella surugensis]MCL1127153.1 bifunctional indole-3-glycerol-phosphate synthase TrpC/phosphoribosylanthranilate isomerase TrpF [Shewanella surugensis]